MKGCRVKLAETEAERRQVHALNYRTFVEEIPQHHPPAGSTYLVDRFDAENSYVVAVDAAGDVIAMLALRARQLELYSHIGFEAFGPLVGTAQARFQPMFLAVEAFMARFGNALPGAPGAAT